MKTVFLISFSWASIAGSLVNVDSLFMIFPPPHLCAANQPLDIWNCSCSKRLATPQARRASDKCVTHLLDRAPQTLLGLLGQNPCGHKEHAQAVPGQERVLPGCVGQCVRWLEGFLWLPTACCVATAILFPSLASFCSS